MFPDLLEVVPVRTEAPLAGEEPSAGADLAGGADSGVALSPRAGVAPLLGERPGRRRLEDQLRGRRLGPGIADALRREVHLAGARLVDPGDGIKESSTAVAEPACAQSRWK